MRDGEKKKWILLDRDGVINYESPDYIKTPDECRAIPGSLEAIARLNRYGYGVLVVTNQSGVARGYYSLQTLADIHQKLLAELKIAGGHIEEFFFCPHLPEEHCLCRKPEPGMFFNLQKKYHIDLADVFFVGDSLCDLKAAQAAGCQFLLVMTGNGAQLLLKHPHLLNTPHFANLSQAVDYIISHC